MTRLSANPKESTWRLTRAVLSLLLCLVVVAMGYDPAAPTIASVVRLIGTPSSDCGHCGNTQTQLQTIRGQIELFRMKNNGRYPDFEHTEWNDLLGCDYMRARPWNIKTLAMRVTIGEDHRSAEAWDGWVWNPRTHTLYAAFFDEAGASDGDPATPQWVGP